MSIYFTLVSFNHCQSPANYLKLTLTIVYEWKSVYPQYPLLCCIWNIVTFIVVVKCMHEVTILALN